MMQKELITEIYELYSRELYIYINRYTHSDEASEDLLQDTFHNLIRYSQNHKIEKDKVRAFLYRTAHNLCVNLRKKESRISFTLPEDATQISGANEASGHAETRELESRIYELLEELDPLTRSIFIMKKENNMNVEDIAKSTGKSARTVRRRLEKALSWLHTALKQGGFLLLFMIIKMSKILSWIV